MRLAVPPKSAGHQSPDIGRRVPREQTVALQRRAVQLTLEPDAQGPDFAQPRACRRDGQRREPRGCRRPDRIVRSNRTR